MSKITIKLINITLLTIILIQYLSVITFAATEISQANLKKDHAIKTNIQFLHKDGTWHNVICNYICYTNNGKKYPAYCIKHGVNGVDEEGPYTVEISELLSDEKIWRTIVNGYPYKTPEQLGVETEDDAYLATKQAVNSVMLNRDVKSFYRGKNEKGKKIVEAIYKISEIGKNGTQTIPNVDLSIEQIKDLTKYNEEYYYQEYKVRSDISISNYMVENIKGFPKDSYIADENGNRITNFDKEKNFRVMIPQKYIISDFTGTIEVKAKCSTYPIFFGKSPSSKLQDYAITYDIYEDFKITEKFIKKVNISKINIIKQDEENLKPIEGVKYKLTNKEGKTIDIQTTNNEGKIIFENLYPGKYLLQEINTNPNYILDSTEYEIELKYDDTIIKELKNKHKKGSLKIIKVDKDDNDITLGAIEFDLMNEEKEVIAHLSTNADGEAIIENINTGNYILKETKTKKEYDLCIDTDIKVEWNKLSEIKIENEKKKGQIKIIKEDLEKSGIKLEGVTFEILDNRNRIIEKITTNEKGEAITSRIPIGEYRIKEVDLGLNNNYILNDDIYNIEVKNNETINLLIQNERKKGSIKICKIDKDTKLPIEGIMFEVIDSDGFKYTQTTNKDGIAVIDNVRSGIVTIRESYTKEEYVLDKEAYKIEVNYKKQSELTLENEKKKGQVEVFKTDEEDREIKLQNVEFEITDKNNNLLDKIVTNREGYAISKRLPIGDYYIKEVKTNKNYVLNNEIKLIQIEEDEIITLNLANRKQKGKINIIKTSSKDSPILEIKKGDTLPNVTFEIYDNKNNLVDTIITDEKGQAISKELEIGRYKIKEINTLKHYILNLNEFFINIEEDGQTKILEVENEPAIPKLNIEKIGQDYAYTNEEIAYRFNIKNDGNVELNNFTWSEYIPYEKVKITKLVTGIYNSNINYKLYYKTNKNDYIFLKEINSCISEYLDFTSLKLSKNEIITEIKVEYGTVPIEFNTIIEPTIFVKTKNNTNENEIIINKTELTGKVEGKELKDESIVQTKIIERKIEKKLPRTGY